MKFGRFDNEKREYVITRPDTPRPWANYLGSAEFGALVTNNAAGYTFYRSAAQGRLTRFRFNAPTADMPGKFVYLRDVDNDDVWSATWQPVGKPTETFACECRHGTGYTIVTSQYADIACETRYFIPLGARAEVWLVTLRNTGRGVRRLRAFPFIEPGCNWNALDDAQNLQYTHFIAHAEGAPGALSLRRLPLALQRRARVRQGDRRSRLLPQDAAVRRRRRSDRLRPPPPRPRIQSRAHRRARHPPSARAPAAASARATAPAACRGSPAPPSGTTWP